MTKTLEELKTRAKALAQESQNWGNSEFNKEAYSILSTKLMEDLLAALEQAQSYQEGAKHILELVESEGMPNLAMKIGYFIEKETGMNQGEARDIGLKVRKAIADEIRKVTE